MNNNLKLYKLSDLKVGQVAKVIKIKCKSEEIKRHLLDMGITRGTIIQIKSKAPLGDPIELYLRDYTLCIRKSDLESILVEVKKNESRTCWKPK